MFTRWTVTSMQLFFITMEKGVTLDTRKTWLTPDEAELCFNYALWTSTDLCHFGRETVIWFSG